MSCENLALNVSEWIKRTDRPFNESLQFVASIYNGKYPERRQVGWENIGWGVKIFTGLNYCDTASEAYGVALSEKFPFIRSLQRIWFQHHYGSLHSILVFSVNDSDYFVDGTYGQIRIKPNEVLTAPLPHLLRYYRNDWLSWETLDTFKINTPGLAHKVIEGKRIIAKFNPRPLSKRLASYIKEGNPFGYWEDHGEEAVLHLAAELLKVE